MAPVAEAAAGSDEHEAVRVVGRAAARRPVRGRHDPLAAASGHGDGRPARLAPTHAVPRAPAAAAAAHHRRLTLDAERRARHQHLGPVAERRPAARPPALRHAELRAVPARRPHQARSAPAIR